MLCAEWGKLKKIKLIRRELGSGLVSGGTRISTQRELREKIMRRFLLCSDFFGLQVRGLLRVAPLSMDVANTDGHSLSLGDEY